MDRRGDRSTAFSLCAYFIQFVERKPNFISSNVIVLRHHSTVTDPSIHGRGSIPEGGVRTCKHRPKGPHCGLLVVGASGHTLGLCLFVIDGDKATL
jgi:hypothetical protein